jgi:hypothetical protein
VVADSQYDIATPDFAANLKIERLTPRVSATVASRILVEEDGAEWISVVDYQVTDGSLDRIELRISDTIMPPLQIAGDGIYRRDMRRDGADQVWTIQLEEPHWSSYRLVLRARVDVGQGSSLPVPAVHPTRVADIQRYLLALNATEDKYEIRGVENQRSVPSDGFSKKWFSEPVPKNALGAFELREPVGKIELHRVQPAQAMAPQSAMLERHRAWLRPAGAIVAESTLLIQARADGVESLSLPESARLLDMRVDGQVTRPSLNSDGQLAFPLTASDRPYEVQLWWSWDRPTAAGTSDNERVELPRLAHDDCPAVWSVFVPPQWRLASSSVPATSRSLLEATHAQAIAEELDRLLKSPSSLDPSDRPAVLLDAEQLFMLAADIVSRSLGAEAEIGLSHPKLRVDHGRAAVQLRRLNEQNRELLERTGLASLRARAEAQLPRLVPAGGAAFPSSVQRASTSASTTPATHGIALPHQGRPEYFAAESQGLALLLESSDSRKDILIKHLPVALVGLLALGAYLWLIRAERQSLALAIGLGVLGGLWCWKMRFEPIGPALLLAAVSVALSGLRRQRSRPSKPTVA